MKLDTVPAGNSMPVAPAPEEPGDGAQKRAIADAVWTDLLWLMPPDRTVTVTVRGGTGLGSSSARPIPCRTTPVR